MADSVRCFVAIRVAPGAVEALQRAQERLRRTGADVKLVETRNLHLTLKFLGDVESARLPDVLRVVQAIAAGTPRMAGRIHGVGAFPNERAPRVIWAGMDFEPDAARTLAARIDAELAPLGFARETRPFASHVTLGRVRSPRGRKSLAQELEKLSGSEFGRQPVERLTVFQSVLSAAGPEYTALAEYDLA